MQKLVDIATLSTAPLGTTIVKEGDYGEEFFWIASGRIEIQMTAQLEGGNPVTLNSLNSGEVFGELSLLGINPRVASALAIANVELYVWKVKECMSFFKEHSDIGYQVTLNLGNLIGQRLAAMNKEFRDRSKMLDIRLLQNLG